ncbi:hypothetical protein LPB142_16480 [Rhodobacter xanthinilyticus]|uniref:Uncharacterized protein n=1 Tax=Rhodobacter xanthinilyticus TaxID=1850250 RepID=A0A1D9MG41_9RHOB|nr:hypothetical protein [Rhodobacter xanthinilyticus]AOZ70729.1 hypothetical protein LPB142_16480 [Rhodobacter xanthinilyticus]
MSDGKIRFEVVRVANVKAAERRDAVFFEVHELFEVDGVEKRHRNADIYFETRAEAEEWVKNQEE